MRHSFPIALLAVALSACGGSPNNDPHADLAHAKGDPAADNGDPGDLAQPHAAPDMAGGIVAGCWMTHTSSGDTELDLTQSGSTVGGTESYGGDVFQVTNGVLDSAGLRFTVDWTDYNQTCDLNFTSVSATALSGMSTCNGYEQDITADRTCT